jgi:hypothetical protein
LQGGARGEKAADTVSGDGGGLRLELPRKTIKMNSKKREKKGVAQPFPFLTKQPVTCESSFSSPFQHTPPDGLCVPNDLFCGELWMIGSVFSGFLNHFVENHF